MIGASLRYLYEDRFQCFQKDFKTDEQYKTHINRNNCKREMTNKNAFFKFDNIRYKTCFCNFYNPQVLTLINISRHLKEFGELPSYLTEDKLITNKMYETHNLIQQYLNELEKIELEKQKQKLKG